MDTNPSQNSAERTPTQTIIQVLEDFGEDEPLDVIAIWITKGGDIAWSTGTRRMTQYVGMCETIAHILKERVRNQLVIPE